MGIKYTKEKIDKMFREADLIIELGETNFKLIEKKFIGNAKGFGYIVDRHPEYRKKMYELMAKCIKKKDYEY